jgi:hypothetical protein
MDRIVIAVVVSLLAGFAIGALWMTEGGRDDATSAYVAAAADAAGTPESMARLEQLERIVEEEREARLALEDTLAMLFEELEQLEGRGARAAERRDDPSDEDAATRRGSRRPDRNEVEWMRNFMERRVGRLVEGGFSEDEARRILQQESEATFKSMQMAWEAQRSGEPLDPFDRLLNPQSLLREELGDTAYARYLAVQGQPTSISVTQVMSGSPGSSAGLEPGDQLVSYDGERVFTVGDLRNLTMQGEPGQDVVIEVERDGVRMQLTVPRGPIGITGSGANVRGLNWWGT